jgi:hypothetical protein
MPKLLIVEKTGVITEKNVKSIQSAELYKVAGFKTADGFKCFTTWTPEVNGQKYTIQLFAKSVGRANNENKYEFPPPVDSTLFYGNCILIHSSGMDTEIKDLSKSEWTAIYEYLYGGFEDIGNEDSELSEDEYDDEIGENAELTKNGYVKDGFIVDDDDEDDDYEDEDDEDDEDADDEDMDEEEYIRPVVNKSQNQKKKRPTKKTSNHAIVIDTSSSIEPANYLDCTSELEIEEYIV